MDDLNSIAFRSSCIDDKSSSINSSSQCRAKNHIGVFNADNMFQYDMEMMSSSEVPFVDDADLSTGYLQDVFFDFTSKRRRLLMEMLPHHHHTTQNYCWTSDLIKNCCQEFDTLTQFTKPDDIIPDLKRGHEGEANSETYDSSSCSQKELMSSADNQWTPHNYKGNIYCLDPIFDSPGNEKRKKKRMLAKVVYPFALVKPGGFEGDMTLNDINERILMPPTRPVRHPVGDFACRPMTSPVGPGLSGKAVVAFTRIQTQGRGTITIIRTRG